MSEPNVLSQLTAFLFLAIYIMLMLSSVLVPVEVHP